MYIYINKELLRIDVNFISVSCQGNLVGRDSCGELWCVSVNITQGVDND